jgi:hypothetical protein
MRFDGKGRMFGDKLFSGMDAFGVLADAFFDGLSGRGVAHHNGCSVVFGSIAV